MAWAVEAPNGTTRPLPPLPLRMIAVPPGKSRSAKARATTSPARAPVSSINRNMASSRR